MRLTKKATMQSISLLSVPNQSRPFDTREPHLPSLIPCSPLSTVQSSPQPGASSAPHISPLICHDPRTPGYINGVWGDAHPISLVSLLRPTTTCDVTTFAGAQHQSCASTRANRPKKKWLILQSYKVKGGGYSQKGNGKRWRAGEHVKSRVV